jgi:DNA-binding CsgD family transcriptional regulator
LLCWLSEILWCPGRTDDSNRAAHEAVALLETLPPSRELAYGYTRLDWRRADRSLALAEQLGDTELTIRARAVIGSRDFQNGGSQSLEECFQLARNAGLIDLAGLVLSLLVSSALAARRYELAARYIDLGLPFCSDRGIELYRSYLLAYQARLELDQGRWEAAAEAATAALRTQRASIMPRILGLAVLGLIRARRGDPGHQELLDEAWSLAEPTRELFRIGPAVAARAEVAWLTGDHAAVASATEDPLRKALKHGDRNVVGELGVWRRRAGFHDDVAAAAAEPFAAQLAGEWARAAAFWDEAGCPYEAALARADSDDEEQLRHALDELQRLGARPAAAIVASRLRKRGARGLPRGPRRATRENPAGLTPRQLEVLALVVEGLQDSEIAARLVVSERTVGHHVSAILRKLEVRNRGQAAAAAVRFGLVSQDR